MHVKATLLQFAILNVYIPHVCII